MVTKKNKDSKIIIWFILGGIVFGSILILLFNLTFNKVQEGDRLVNSLHISQGLKDYEEAQTLWPFLQYNAAFKTKTTKAKEIVTQIFSKPAVTIYLNVTASDTDITQLINSIKTTPGVTQVKYNSKEDAFVKYKEMNKNDPSLLQIISPDLLPANIEIYISNQSIKSKIANLAQNKPFVSNVVVSSSD